MPVPCVRWELRHALAFVSTTLKQEMPWNYPDTAVISRKASCPKFKESQGEMVDQWDQLRPVRELLGFINQQLCLVTFWGSIVAIYISHRAEAPNYDLKEVGNRVFTYHCTHVYFEMHLFFITTGSFKVAQSVMLLRRGAGVFDYAFGKSLFFFGLPGYRRHS